jgi:hypothetical protein
MTERLGVVGVLHASLLATVTTPLTAARTPATNATSGVIDTQLGVARKYLVETLIKAEVTAATAATVAIEHSTASTGGWAVASKGTAAWQVTVGGAGLTAGVVQEIEIRDNDIAAASLNRYLRANVTPAGAFLGTVSVEILTDTARYQPNTSGEIATLNTPLIIADL